MEKTKRKQAFDLLDLPQKERVRLCREIRSILKQKVLEERASQQELGTEPQESYRTLEAMDKIRDSSLTKIKNSSFWNRLT